MRNREGVVDGTGQPADVIHPHAQRALQRRYRAGQHARHHRIIVRQHDGAGRTSHGAHAEPDVRGRRLAERSMHGRIDVALMPIGAYEPRWFMGYQHLDPRQALDAFQELGARSMLGMHWGVFDLTDEAPNRAIQEIGDALAERAARGEPLRGVHVPAIGERWLLPPEISKTP